MPLPLLFDCRFHGGECGEEVETVNKEAFCRFFLLRIVICLGGKQSMPEIASDLVIDCGQSHRIVFLLVLKPLNEI